MDISLEIEKIAEHYGYESRSNLLVEECAELIQAVSKYRRAQTAEKAEIALENLVEEIVDVEIMLEQIKYLLQIPEGNMQALKICKINRTKENMVGSKGA